MFDTTTPVAQKTFIAIHPIGFTPNEKIPYPVEWRLELFSTPEPDPGVLGQYYADAIPLGSTVQNVITKVMKDVFHATNWQLLSLADDGLIPDCKGDMIPRVRVEVAMNPDETIGIKVISLYPVWKPNNRVLLEHEYGMLAQWYGSFISTSTEVFQHIFDGLLASLHDVDRIISESWGTRPPTAIQSVVSTFGTYIGEILVKETGGSWVMHDGLLVIKILNSKEETIYANVFHKTWKRLINGEEDSLEYYVTAMLKLLSEKN